MVIVNGISLMHDESLLIFNQDEIRFLKSLIIKNLKDKNSKSLLRKLGEKTKKDCDMTLYEIIFGKKIEDPCIGAWGAVKVDDNGNLLEIIDNMGGEMYKLPNGEWVAGPNLGKTCKFN